MYLKVFEKYVNLFLNVNAHIFHLKISNANTFEKKIKMHLNTNAFAFDPMTDLDMH